MKKTPKYIKSLENLGIDIKRLWSEKERRFLRKSELIQRVGEEEFKVLETIGRTIREGRWKEEVRKMDIERELRALSRKYNSIPQEALQLLKKKEVSSLELHYIKRKYYDGWNLKSPKELDEMFVKHIKNPEGLIYKQGGRIAIELDRFVAVIHPPDTKITLFKLKDKYRDYEDYANQMNMPILKLWQLKYILKRL
ncbi:MAG: hypothetical protein GXO18_04090 [Aquificae bacterium]|nr:hypothetical protein [Aquificota bacterium]